MRYLLDTHAWIWWNVKPESLSPRVLKLIQDVRYDELLLSAISIWEFSKLLEKRRLSISCDGMRWITEALDMPRLRVVEVTPSIVWQSIQLPKPFHDDPADQLIVATARDQDAILLTADRLLLDYQHVRTDW